MRLRYLIPGLGVLVVIFLFILPALLPSGRTPTGRTTQSDGAAGAWTVRLPPDAKVITETMIEERSVGPQERTVFKLTTTGLMEVVVFAETDDADLNAFKSGATPRTAKVFTNIRELVYPLASQEGTTVYVRVHPLVAGETSLQYEAGTIEEAMARLRNGQNLVRNQGVIEVSDLHLMPIYQLVPGTIIKVTRQAGQGRVALLRTLDYLAVKKGEVALASLCTTNPCLDDTGQQSLEVYLDDYEDRYLVVQAESGAIRVSYAVIATPEVLNYAVSCN